MTRQGICDPVWKKGVYGESGSMFCHALVEEHLIVGNLGDARGIIGRSVADPKRFLQWKKWVECTSIDDYYGDRGCLWKEVTMVTVRRGRMNEHELKRLTVDHDRDGNSNCQLQRTTLTRM
jgi:hypothetical protein